MTTIDEMRKVLSVKRDRLPPKDEAPSSPKDKKGVEDLLGEIFGIVKRASEGVRKIRKAHKGELSDWGLGRLSAFNEIREKLFRVGLDRGIDFIIVEGAGEEFDATPAEEVLFEFKKQLTRGLSSSSPLVDFRDVLTTLDTIARVHHFEIKDPS